MGRFPTSDTTPEIQVACSLVLHQPRPAKRATSPSDRPRSPRRISCTDSIKTALLRLGWLGPFPEIDHIECGTSNKQPSISKVAERLESDAQYSSLLFNKRRYNSVLSEHDMLPDKHCKEYCVGLHF